MEAVIGMLKSRKALVAVLLIIGATVLVALGDMSVDQWIDIIKWLYGLFVAGNIGSKVAKNMHKQ
jgi:hypothetical protein